MGPYRERSNEVIESLVELIESEHGKNSREAITEIFKDENLEERKLSIYAGYLSRLLSQKRRSDVAIDKGVSPSFIYHLHEKFVSTSKRLVELKTQNIIQNEVKNKIKSLNDGLLLLKYWQYEENCKNLYVETSEDDLNFIKNYRNSIAKKEINQSHDWLKIKSSSTALNQELDQFTKDYIQAFRRHQRDFPKEKEAPDNLLKNIDAIDDLILDESDANSSKQKKLVATFLSDILIAIEKFESGQLSRTDKLKTELEKLEKQANKSNLNGFDFEKLYNRINYLKKIMKSDTKEAQILASDIVPLPSKDLLKSIIEWIKRS